MYLHGTGTVDDLDLRADRVDADVLTVGDTIRAARVDDRGMFELEGRMPSGMLLPLEPEQYRTTDATLLELRITIWTTDQHFVGPGLFWLSDTHPDWLGIFELNNPVEGFAADAIDHDGTIQGCFTVRAPDNPPLVDPLKQ